MTDDPPESESGASEADPPEEWVESIADAEGIPTEEVIERLVSSYWTLTEMHDMLGGLDDGIELDAIDADVDVGDATSADGAVADDIEAIRERLDRIEAELEEEGDIRRAVETDLAKLTQRVDAIEGELRDRQSSLESRFDAELENLATVLEYLIDTTDALEEDVGAISEEWGIVRRRRGEQERLTSLRRIASRLDVRSAACEHCGTAVDIGLLPTADCPHCDREFVDIEPATGWFGLGTDTLVTARDPSVDVEERGE